MTRLSDKLKALGVELGTSSLLSKSAISAESAKLSEVVNGEYTHSDQVFETLETFSADYQHGKYILWLETFNHLQNLINLDFKLQDLIFIDAETTGLSSGTGTFAFMLGLGWFDEHNAFHVKQIFLPEPSCENAYLSALTEELARFTTIVSFNGKSFDIPLIKTRYVLHTAPSPFEDMAHIDLLHLARRIWRYRLASRTLGELETHILHFTRGEVELPGWMAPKLYLDYLSTKDAAPMKGMFYHNQIDIVSLAALLCVLENMAGLKTDSPAELFALSEFFEHTGDIPGAIEAYKQTISIDNNMEFAPQANYRLGLIHRRAGDWPNAISYWMQAAVSLPDACIELAKYYEHQTRDYNEAESWCKFALSLNHQMDKIEEIEYRMNRILRKKRRRQGAP
jgi:uncharacterized protein